MVEVRWCPLCRRRFKFEKEQAMNLVRFDINTEKHLECEGYVIPKHRAKIGQKDKFCVASHTMV